MTARKRSSSLGLSLLVGTICAGSAAADDGPEPDLVAYWSFDEGSGTLLRDGSGHGHDGILMNGPAWVSGLLGSALLFDGRDDYVQFAGPVLNTAPYTVCTWAWPDPPSAGRTRYVIANGGDTGASYGFHQNLTLENRWEFGVRNQDGTRMRHVSCPAPTASFPWRFLCGTWDGSAAPGSVKLYVDGKLQAAGDPQPESVGAARNLRIGASTTSTYWYMWQGYIDEVRIYSAALSAAEIRQLYARGFDLRGDLNCDRAVDFGDINPFTRALVDPNAYASKYPHCDIQRADINDDGLVDFGDINPFIALLSGGG